ncbi:hypothetical protein DL95DRAFT_445979 [Leptodontidium sp. 2 PMI_412]|nr:hypothetical protein DL95DRAFT_445979 [Leptodontidium sp. 2 PMI_412]
MSSSSSSSVKVETQIGQRPDFCRILLLGKNGSGKTAFLTRFTFNAFPPPPTYLNTPYFHSHFPRLRIHRVISSLPCIVELVEAEPRRGSVGDGDGEMMVEIGNADAVVLVYSVCGLRWHPLHRDCERHGSGWRRELLEGVRRFGGLVRGVGMGLGRQGWGEGEEEEEGVVMMVLGCQRDRDELRIVSEAEGRAVARELGCGFAEVEVESGREDANAVVDTLVMEIRERRKRRAEIEEWRKGGSSRAPAPVPVPRKDPTVGMGLWERILHRWGGSNAI